MNFIAIVGTNANFSYNRLLLKYMEGHFNNDDSIEVIEISELPSFCEDLKIDDFPDLLTIGAKIRASDGIIFGCPEYDHAIPAALKSLIEWLTYSQNYFKEKPVFVIGASYGIQGAARAQMQLKQIMSSPDVMSYVLPGNEFLLGNVQGAFNADFQLKDNDWIKKLETEYKEFRVFSAKINS